MCKRGEVYYANLGEGKGSRQGGTRPVVIIQNNIGNKFSPTVIVACLTSKNKKSMPTHVDLSTAVGLELDSKVLCEQILTINKTDLQGNVVCELPQYAMSKIDEALSISLGLKREQEEITPEVDQELINQMVTVLRTKKTSSKAIFTMFVRYCNSVNVDYKQYKDAILA